MNKSLLSPLKEPGVGLTVLLLLVLLGINAVAVWGILVAGRDAERAALNELELHTLVQARAVEALVASRRGDFIFLAQSPPVANAPSILAARDPLMRRWGRLDVEGSLLLFMAAHPEVERIAVFDPSGRALVATGRRDDAPVLFPPQDVQPTESVPEGYLLGTWPLGPPDEERGMLEVLLNASLLLDLAAPGMGDRLSLYQRPSLETAYLIPAEGDWRVVTAPVRDEGWVPPVRWTLVRRENPSQLVDSVAILAGRYRSTLFLNVVVIMLALVLGFVALRQVRRSLALEMENRQQARIRELERKVFHSERLASVGRLAAGIAHEINNPLEGMSNYLGLLREDVAAGNTEGARELLDRVREGLNRAASVTRQVLTLSEPGDARREPVDLREVLEDTLRFVRSNPAFQNIDIRFDRPGQRLEVLGNRTLLGQLFLNLVLNACQVQPEGGRVELAGRRAGQCAHITVEDEGPGISPEALSRVFEPFYSERGSTGLGLSVCHGIVVQHGGEIRARNRPQGGALFEVELTLQEGEKTTGEIALAPAGSVAGGNPEGGRYGTG